MRSNIKNKVQLNVMVPPETKNHMHEIAEALGMKPHNAVEIALARLHAQIKLDGRSESVIEILMRLESKIDQLHDES